MLPVCRSKTRANPTAQRWRNTVMPLATTTGPGTPPLVMWWARGYACRALEPRAAPPSGVIDESLGFARPVSRSGRYRVRIRRAGRRERRLHHVARGEPEDPVRADAARTGGRLHG